MLIIFRRHLKKCEHRSEGRKYRRCHCPIWVDGFIGGCEIRQSLKLRDWNKAQDQVRHAVLLSRDRIREGKLLLYTAKTGTPVYCPLPDVVVNALDAVLRPGSPYYFWSGESKPKSAVGDWQRSLAKLFELAKVPGAHAHRFRDTFSVESLLAGIPIEQVSALLGHQSLRVTERHYSPWVRARQEQLEASVRRVWALDPVVSATTKGTHGVRGKTERVN